MKILNIIGYPLAIGLILINNIILTVGVFMFMTMVYNLVKGRGEE